jgi:hypothetical protein
MEVTQTRQMWVLERLRTLAPSVGPSPVAAGTSLPPGRAAGTARNFNPDYRPGLHPHERKSPADLGTVAIPTHSVRKRPDFRGIGRLAPAERITDVR